MNLLASFGLAKWLLWQASFSYLGLAVAIVLSALCGGAALKQRWMLTAAALPMVWITPIAISGLAVDLHTHAAKSAGWTGWLTLLSLSLFAGLVASSVWKAKGFRSLAILAGGVNAPMVLLSAAVVGMASTGDWI